MCYVIANFNYEDIATARDNPGDGLMRTLINAPFPSLATAYAALSHALEAVTDEKARAKYPANARMVEKWLEYPIVLFDIHDSGNHVILSGLPNSEDPSVKAVTDILLEASSAENYDMGGDRFTLLPYEPSVVRPEDDREAFALVTEYLSAPDVLASAPNSPLDTPPGTSAIPGTLSTPSTTSKTLYGTSNGLKVRGD